MLETIHWLCWNLVMTLGDKDSPLCFTHEAMEKLGMEHLVHGHTATIQSC